MSDNLEYCFKCDEPTGCAGRADDSHYNEDGEGPFCWRCWCEDENPKLHEEVDKLQAQLTAANDKIERLEGIIVRFKAGCKITGKGPVDKDCEAVRLANEENERLKEFTRHVINVECWSVDGADIQEKAEELGLIIPHTVTEEDADDDYGVGDTRFKFSETLKENEQ